MINMQRDKYIKDREFERRTERRKGLWSENDEIEFKEEMAKLSEERRDSEKNIKSIFNTLVGLGGVLIGFCIVYLLSL